VASTFFAVRGRVTSGSACLSPGTSCYARLLAKLEINTQEGATDDDSRISLRLYATKADPCRMGITNTIAAASDARCPVKALRHLFNKYPLLNFNPLFSPTREPTAALDSAFTGTKFFIRIRDIVLELVMSGNSSGHSFRPGAETWACSNVTPDADLHLLGRCWLSLRWISLISSVPNSVGRCSWSELSG
jgi:hypothetical protein